MNQKIIDKIKIELSIKQEQVINVLDLLKEGNTVPFIARYRKEMTNNLDEEQIRLIEKEYEYLLKMSNRKEEVIRLIDEKGMLTSDLVKVINSCNILQEIEDIYLPFKEKRKTKATEAIKFGLEPLAEYILSEPIKKGSIKEEAKKYITLEIDSIDIAIENAGYIVSEKLSEMSAVRQYLRKEAINNGILNTKIKKGSLVLDEKKKYQMYYDFSQSIKKLPSYRILAFNRGEKEKILNVALKIDNEKIIQYLEKQIIKTNISDSTEYLKTFIKDCYKRLLSPSLFREIRAMLTEEASNHAINLFATNLETLLMQPPVKNKTILGIDPAFRTGCKLAVIDQTSKLLEIKVIYPTAPREEVFNSEKKLNEIISKYPINQIVIGNGTASRETEAFIKNWIKKEKYKIPVSIVSEAGASVYSASKVAKEEFPNLQVEERSAVSIARRVQDPMAELVKIEPKAIGVGQYQHDVNQKELGENLDFVMIKNINKVGVNINTASSELLKYVSGLDKKIAKNIVEYREENGEIKSRIEIKKIKRLGPKAFEQCAGFLKILDGKDLLDSTFIHPESYKEAKSIIKECELDISKMGNEKFVTKIKKIDPIKLSEKLNINLILTNDILESLKSSQLDLREELETAEFSADITNIDQININMMIKGQIRNIVDFGAFVDIGIKNDGLVHISEVSDSFVKDVTNHLKIGDIKEFRVKEVDIEKQRVQLSLKKG